MKTRMMTLLLAMMASMGMSAQYTYNSSYDVWFEGSDGYKQSGAYGDDVSMVNGKWKCVTGRSVRYVDIE